MGEQSERRKPVFARTDFEAMTHEQLVAMLESASHEGAQTLHTKLGKAASTISKIGDDLMQYVKDLEWQGDGGDAFRDWAAQTASATLNLGEYALISSRCMQVVSQAIAEAKSAMPDTSETQQARADLKKAHETIAATTTSSARHDPDARKLTQTAESNAEEAEYRIEKIRHEAIQQLRKLAQTYEATGQQVNSMSPPTFSPPADHAGAASWWRNNERDLSVGGYSPEQKAVSHAAHMAGTPHLHLPVDTATSGPGISQKGASQAAESVAPTTQPASFDLDGAALMPRTPEQSSSVPASPHARVPHQEPATLGQPSPLSPVLGSGSHATGSPSSTPRLPSLPHAGGGTSSGSGRVPRISQETGIIGGRPVSSASSRPHSGISSGTVIGKEGAQGRTVMPRAIAGQGPIAGGSGGTRGMPGGRRLASEPGPSVGTRQQIGRSSGWPFTPGGTGLIRPSTKPAGPSRESTAGAAHTQGAITQSHDSRKDREKGQRPNYLVEDEETWVRDDRRPLPPVVD